MIKHSVKVSLIVVNYNGQYYLNRLLKSIKEQTVSSHETIIVDNDSTDNSISLLSKTKYPHFLIKSKNIGYGQGCNLGATVASGQYLVFLNPDTYLDKNYLKKIIQSYSLIKKNSQKKIGCINCNILDFESNINLSPAKVNSIIDIFGNPRGVKSKSSRNDSFVVLGTGLFIARNIFKKIGGFHPSIFLYGEELDLCWRLKITGHLIASVDGPILHHQGSGSFGNNRASQLAYMTYGSFVASFTNYQLTTLFLILPLYAIYLSVLFLLVPFYLKFNFNYSIYLFKHFCSFFGNLSKFIKFRHQVQSKRNQSDLYIRKYISPIPTIFVNLYRSFTSTNTSLSQKNDN